MNATQLTPSETALEREFSGMAIFLKVTTAVVVAAVLMTGVIFFLK